MCGIVGILADLGRVSPRVLELATRSLAHRGPDDSGTVIFRERLPRPVEIGLGNRRLAILDLSPLGHQPMHDPENGNWLVYNGEIYNFREIRQELQSSGVDFIGHSDTEVLLRAYGYWGDGCLAKLRGIFAFAIWDARRHCLFMARDPMGVKPLYYGNFDGQFLFASEVRTLLNTGLVPRRIDRAGLLNYLAFGSAYDPLTLIEGISALPAGHSLTWQASTIGQQRYWDLAHTANVRAPLSSARRRELEDELHAELVHSIRLQVVSDVPLGVFLSGGIDSSVVASILARHGCRLRTFSMVFNEADFSEAQYSRQVAQALGSEHQELLVSQQDALAAIPLTLQAMDQPTVDGLNTYILSRHTRAAGIKVALSGLGGDELFAGYSSFRTVPRMERFLEFWAKLPPALRQILSGTVASCVPHKDQYRKLKALTSASGDILHPYFLARMLFTAEQNDALLLATGAAERERALLSIRDCLRTSSGLDSVNRVSYLESQCYMTNTLLRDADVMSMAHGLEARVPLADHRLAEKLMALPGSWKVNARRAKPLLADAVRAGLPLTAIHRPKRGFCLPLERWLRDQLWREVETTLKRIASGPLSQVLHAAAAQQVWQEFQERRCSWSRPWALYVLERWCELHAVGA